MHHRPVIERDAAWFEARAVEALFGRGLGRPLPPRLHRRLRELGVDLSRPLLPAYARRTVEAALEVAAEELAPGHAPPRAHRLLGERLARGFVTSVRARAIVTAARAFGTERSIARAAGSHPTPTNFMHLKLTREHAGRYLVHLTWRPPFPELIEGICAGLLVALGAHAVQVEPREGPVDATVLALQFQP
jgi:uncharacterized protein (TIGR02265 family)